jgi:hypothetical protein
MAIPYGLHHRPGVDTPLRRMMLDNDRTARTTAVRDTYARRHQTQLLEEAEERHAQAEELATKVSPTETENYDGKVQAAERNLEPRGRSESKR